MADVEYLNLSINGQAIKGRKGQTIWAAAKDAGIFIPIYCYHPKMPPLGACRICLVEVEKTPKPQAACTTAISEGMVVRTEGSYAEKARDVLGQAARIVTPAPGADGKTIWRARFGLFGEEQARDVCSRLNQRGQTCFAAVASAR